MRSKAERPPRGGMDSVCSSTGPHRASAKQRSNSATATSTSSSEPRTRRTRALSSNDSDTLQDSAMSHSTSILFCMFTIGHPPVCRADFFPSHVADASNFVISATKCARCAVHVRLTFSISPRTAFALSSTTDASSAPAVSATTLATPACTSAHISSSAADMAAACAVAHGTTHAASSGSAATTSCSARRNWLSIDFATSSPSYSRCAFSRPGGSSTRTRPRCRRMCVSVAATAPPAPCSRTDARPRHSGVGAGGPYTARSSQSATTAASHSWSTAATVPDHRARRSRGSLPSFTRTISRHGAQRRATRPSGCSTNACSPSASTLSTTPSAAAAAAPQPRTASPATTRAPLTTAPTS
eukprot:Rhum_TRINITY_DN18471_c0_g1::Rhum_TRINITY_DN18471_c0_g1_i1::g.167310::m.167310